MAQIYYHVLSTPILNSNGEVSSEAASALNVSTKELKQVQKDTYKMVGEDAPVGDLVWKPAATKMLVINFIAITIYVFVGIMSFTASIAQGILLVLCSVIACPIFFKFKDLPASRQYTWRLIRLIVSVIVAMAIAILL